MTGNGAGLYTITVPPAGQPVTLAEARAQLRIDSDLTSEDTLISDLISAAVMAGERKTGRLFAAQTVQYRFSTLWASNRVPYPYVDILRAPVNSVTAASVKSGGSDVDVLSSVELLASGGYPRVFYYSDAAGTVPDDETAFPYSLTFTAGYATIPGDIKTAILSHVAYLYENRGDVASVRAEGTTLSAAVTAVDMPAESAGIYSRYRLRYVFG